LTGAFRLKFLLADLTFHSSIPSKSLQTFAFLYRSECFKGRDSDFGLICPFEHQTVPAFTFSQKQSVHERGLVIIDAPDGKVDFADHFEKTADC
jgi:hypothetical protein